MSRPGPEDVEFFLDVSKVGIAEEEGVGSVESGGFGTATMPPSQRG